MKENKIFEILEDLIVNSSARNITKIEFSLKYNLSDELKDIIKKYYCSENSFWGNVIITEVEDGNHFIFIKRKEK